jgi:hypothetical protein
MFYAPWDRESMEVSALDGPSNFCCSFLCWTRLDWTFVNVSSKFLVPFWQFSDPDSLNQDLDPGLL